MMSKATKDCFLRLLNQEYQRYMDEINALSIGEMVDRAPWLTGVQKSVALVESYDWREDEIMALPYAILGCPLERPAIAAAVQMVWEQFGLSHIVICHREGMELKPGAYKLSGVYGPQPVSVVQPQALIKTMKRLLRKYPAWSETVNQLNAERREAELDARLRLQAKQREWLEQEQARSAVENEV